MEQFNVSKQSPADAMNWHKYVATFDTTQYCMFLSKRDHSDDPCHHKVLVHQVTLFPHYKQEGAAQTIPEDKEEFSLQLEGMMIPTHDSDRQRVRVALAEQYNALAHPGKAEKRAEEKEAHDREVERRKQEHENHTHQHHHHGHSASGDSDPGVVPALSATEGPVGDQGKTIGKPVKWVIVLSSTDDVRRFVAATQSLRRPAGVTGAMVSMTNANMTDALPAGGESEWGRTDTDVQSPGPTGIAQPAVVPQIVGDVGGVQRAVERSEREGEK